MSHAIPPCGVFILVSLMLIVSISPVFSEADDRPVWAEEGTYFLYSEDLKYIVENENMEKSEIYLGSGTLRGEIEGVTENYATVDFTSDLTWENEKVFFGFKEDEDKENWMYSLGAMFFLSEGDLKDLREGNVPEGLENGYQGVGKIRVPFATVKSFQISASGEGTYQNYDASAYYGYDTGFLLKYFYEGETFVGEYDYVKVDLELQDTNLEMAERSPYFWANVETFSATISTGDTEAETGGGTSSPWVTIGIIVAAVSAVIIIAVIFSKKYLRKGGESAADSGQATFFPELQFPAV